MICNCNSLLSSLLMLTHRHQGAQVANAQGLAMSIHTSVSFFILKPAFLSTCRRTFLHDVASTLYKLIYCVWIFCSGRRWKKDIGSSSEGRIGPHLNLSSLHSPYQAEIGHGYTDVWLWQRGCIKAPLPSLLQIYRRLLLSDQQISSIEVVRLKFKTDKNVINLLRKWFPLQLATACISEYLHVPLMIVANSTFWLIFF